MSPVDKRDAARPARPGGGPYRGLAHERRDWPEADLGGLAILLFVCIVTAVPVAISFARGEPFDAPTHFAAGIAALTLIATTVETARAIRLGRRARGPGRRGPAAGEPR